MNAVGLAALALLPELSLGIVLAAREAFHKDPSISSQAFSALVVFQVQNKSPSVAQARSPCDLGLFNKVIPKYNRRPPLKPVLLAKRTREHSKS